jgi:hypothetical protein
VLVLIQSPRSEGGACHVKVSDQPNHLSVSVLKLVTGKEAMKLETLNEALEQFTLATVSQDKPLLVSRLRTFLRRYILPSYGFTKTELRNHLDECLALVPIQQFLKDAAQIFYTLQPLANLPASAQTIKKEKLKNYCSALEKFWSWTHCQTYLWATSSHQVLPEVLPEQELHNLQLPTRPKKLTPSLLHHPKKLREFWLNQRVQIRTCCATSYKWNDAHRSNILCTLGWLRHENGQKRLVLAIKQESPLETLQAFIIHEIGDPYDFEGTIIEIFDENDCLKQVTFREALAIAAEQKFASDTAFRFENLHLYWSLTLLPDTPQTLAFWKLAEALRSIATFDFTPANDQQRYWMRCIQNGWQVKSIMLANKIFNLIPDPTQAGRSLGQVLPQAALEELHIATDIEKAIYQLLAKGEQKIREWAQEEKIDYSFETVQELFIHNRTEEFRDNFLEGLLSPNPLWTNKAKQKERYRHFLKFLRNNFDDQPSVEEQYFQDLRSMGWQGYWILALWDYKDSDESFGQLWRAYWKALTAGIKLFDSGFYWRDGIPYRSKQTSQMVSVEVALDSDGYIHWYWS